MSLGEIKTAMIKLYEAGTLKITRLVWAFGSSEFSPKIWLNLKVKSDEITFTTSHCSHLRETQWSKQGLL